jgi:hypothetical protein
MEEERKMITKRNGVEKQFLGAARNILKLDAIYSQSSQTNN